MARRQRPDMIAHGGSIHGGSNFFEQHDHVHASSGWPRWLAAVAVILIGALLSGCRAMPGERIADGTLEGVRHVPLPSHNLECFVYTGGYAGGMWCRNLEATADSTTQ